MHSSDEYVETLRGIIMFFMISAFVFQMFKAIHVGKTIDLDKIDIFTISNDKENFTQTQPSANVSVSIKPKTQKPIQKNVVSKPKRNANGYTQLQQDCFDALKSLGVRTHKERTFIVNSTFNKYNPKTIQEFLKLALMRG